MPLIWEAVIYLVNLSIRIGQFADAWKPLMIAPHHKKVSRALLENYRPVCNIVELGKIAERAIVLQMLNHFHTYKVFHTNLHGGLADFSPQQHMPKFRSNCWRLWQTEGWQLWS